MKLGDEVRMYVHPVLIGEGVPFYPAGVSVDLALRETRTFGNGVVLLRHDVAR
jgi:dihydrofolate reductase